MDSALVEKVLAQLLQRTATGGTQAVIEDAYEPVQFSPDNFVPLETPEDHPTLCCVDGGNAEIIAAPQFALHFIRLHASAYANNKRAWMEHKEGYILVTASTHDRMIVYTAEMFGVDGAPLLINAEDATLRVGAHRVRPSQVAEQARKILEVRFAQEMLSRLAAGDLLVRDGDLQPSATGDEEALDALRAAAAKKKISVCGVSKTTALLTDTGCGVGAALRAIAPMGAWVYSPLGVPPEGRPAVACARLHPRSSHVFRIDAHCADIQAVAAHLAHNSKDPSFLGYPYGLVEADKLARVQHADAEAQRLLIMTKGGVHLGTHLAAQDAHSVLDRLAH